MSDSIENNKKYRIASLDGSDFEAANRFKQAQPKKDLDINALVSEILQQKTGALSKAITITESERSDHQRISEHLIEKCLPYSGVSLRIGITGVPGVGKSTFIEALGNVLVKQGKRVAILAVDPSSIISKGSILGDKTRMASLVQNSEVFIRPSPAKNNPGGVAEKTREAIILCEAAGYDTILVETVGIGQNEIAVHEIVDFFLLLKLPGAGDDLQAIKRGIIEMADMIVINKADGDLLVHAEKAQQIFSQTLHASAHHHSAKKPDVLLCSALKQEGLHEILSSILNEHKENKTSGFFEEKRRKQRRYWFTQTIEEQLKSNFYKHPDIQKNLQTYLDAIEENQLTPFAAARSLLNMLEH